MASAVTLLVLLVAAGDRDPLPGAVERAARQTLGPDATVVVQPIDAAPSDAQAASMGDGAHATAIAEVAWTDAEHRRARLHVRAARDAAWVDREIGFAATDAAAEQGRTIGFALASMLPEAATASASASAPASASASASASAPASASASAPASASASASASAMPSTSTPASEASSPSGFHAMAPGIGAIEAYALVAQAFGGYGGGIGGGLALDWSLGSRVHARVGGSFRATEVAPAAAGAVIGSFALGLGARLAAFGPSERVTLGARVDALAIFQSLTHYDADDTSPDRRSRWLPGADGVVELSWLFTESGAIVVGVGAETAFGSTNVDLSARTVTQLPPVRGLLETGIRVRF